MALLSLEDTFKEDNRSALLRISPALHSLVRTLEEYREVETMLGLDCVPAAYQSRKLVSDIEAEPVIQLLLRMLQKPGSYAEKPASLVGTVPSGRGPEVVCTSGMDAKRVEGAVTWRHSCEFHPELMDPCLWRKLPQELVELVFASLPLAKIFELCVQSSAWSAMSRTSNFRGFCSERHPKLLGFVALDEAQERVCNTVYDPKSNKWIRRELRDRSLTAKLLEGNFLLFACDGGLLCFVPGANLESRPVHVGNPLTDEWRVLPCLPYIDASFSPIMVQLVMEEDLTRYKVILVLEALDEAYYTYYYNSKTGVWSGMESGLVYGVTNSIYCTQMVVPRIFNCTTKVWYELDDCPSVRACHGLIQFAFLKEHLFLLHSVSRFHIKVSEFTWESSLADLSIVDSCKREAFLLSEKAIYLFAGGGYFFVFSDNGEEGDLHHQAVAVHDRSANRWHSYIMRDEFRFTKPELDGVVMCELRWDAVP